MARTIRSQPERLNIAVVGDGETERIYFADMRDTERPQNLTIFPDYPRRIGSYKGVLQRAIELTDDYAHVYALIDMDKIIQEKQQAAYQQDKSRAETHGVRVLELNPCFELWLLRHFTYTTRQFNNCNEVIKELKKDGRIPQYLNPALAN